MNTQYVLTKDSLARALQKWQEDYIASPDDFTIYKDGESQEYGVAAANALIEYLHIVDGQVEILFQN